MISIILILIIFGSVFAIYWTKNRYLFRKLNKFEIKLRFCWLRLFFSAVRMLTDQEKRYTMIERFARVNSGKSFYVWFFQPYLVVNSPEHIEKISQELDKGITSDSISRLIGEGLVTVKPDRWKRSRRIFDPIFRKKNIYDNFLPIYNEYNIRLIDDLKREVKNGGNGGMDIISKSLSDSWNVSLLGFEGQDYRNMKKKMGKASEFLSKQILFPPLRSPKIFEFFLRICGQASVFEDIQNFFLKDIRKKISIFENESPSSHSERMESIVDYLYISHNLSEKEMNDEVMNLLVAGKDTIVTTVFFTLLELAMKLDIQEKVYSECCDVLGDRDCLPTAEDISRLTFLEQCLLESLRLYPAIPLLFRRASSDITLDDNLVVPAGLNLVISPLLTHLSPDYYPNPRQWNPHNFDAARVASRPRYSFLSFGFGQRFCVGKHFAMVAMKSIVATIIRNFQLSTPQKKVRLEFSIVLKSIDGFKIQFHPREPKT